MATKKKAIKKLPANPGEKSKKKILHRIRRKMRQEKILTKDETEFYERHVKSPRRKTGDKELRILGPCPDFSDLKILKGVPMPQARGAFYWDHLINILDEGDAFTLPIKKARSLSARARTMGYVIVLERITDDDMSVWFGGLKK